MSGKKNSSVPKCLHAIWVGGPLREAGRANLEAWRAGNPDYQLKLWIDSGLFEGMPPLAKAYAEPKKKSWKDWLKFKRKKQTQFSVPDDYPQPYKELIRWAQANKVTICDLGLKSSEVPSGMASVVSGENTFLSAMKASNFYNDEISGEYRNYAAASDILRLNILHREGGVYFDCEDVGPGKRPLQKLTPPQGAYLHISAHGLTLANDLIAAVPGNPVIKDALSNCIAKYNQAQPLQIYGHRNYNYTGSGIYRNDHSRLTSTVDMSGPNVLDEALLKHEGEHTDRSDSPYMFPRDYYCIPESLEGGVGSWYKYFHTNQISFFARNHIRAYFIQVLEKKAAETTDATRIEKIKALIRALSFPPEIAMTEIFSDAFLAKKRADGYPPDLISTIQDLMQCSTNIEHFITEMNLLIQGAKHAVQQAQIDLSQAQTPVEQAECLKLLGIKEKSLKDLAEHLKIYLDNIGSDTDHSGASMQLGYRIRDIDREHFVAVFLDKNFREILGIRDSKIFDSSSEYAPGVNLLFQSLSSKAPPAQKKEGADSSESQV